MFTCRHARVTLEPAVERILATAYAEPHRAYHTAAHIAEVLGHFDWVGDEVGWDHPDDVYLAIVFHDAVYDPRATDNEARSAKVARELAGASDRTTAMIELTARHGALEPGALDRDTAHFLDCDVAILAAPAAAFDAYDDAIAVEYAHVPPDAFRAGRGKFLAGMLARPRIFLSDLFHARHDAAARANLARILAQRYGA